MISEYLFKTNHISDGSVKMLWNMEGCVDEAMTNECIWLRCGVVRHLHIRARPEHRPWTD